jgi:hypothetical protein
MGKWTVFLSNGAILQTCYGLEPIPSEIPEGGGYFEGLADSKTEYALDGIKTARPNMAISHPATTSINTEISITGIPAGCEVNHPGGTATVDDGVIEWQSSVEGRFEFSFKCFPYQDEVITIEVTA